MAGFYPVVSKAVFVMDQINPDGTTTRMLYEIIPSMIEIREEDTALNFIDPWDSRLLPQSRRINIEGLVARGVIFTGDMPGSPENQKELEQPRKEVTDGEARTA